MGANEVGADGAGLADRTAGFVSAVASSRALRSELISATRDSVSSRRRTDCARASTGGVGDVAAGSTEGWLVSGIETVDRSVIEGREAQTTTVQTFGPLNRRSLTPERQTPMADNFRRDFRALNACRRSTRFPKTLVCSESVRAPTTAATGLTRTAKAPRGALILESALPAR